MAAAPLGSSVSVSCIYPIKLPGQPCSGHNSSPVTPTRVSLWTTLAKRREPGSGSPRARAGPWLGQVCVSCCSLGHCSIVFMKQRTCVGSEAIKPSRGPHAFRYLGSRAARPLCLKSAESHGRLLWLLRTHFDAMNMIHQEVRTHPQTWNAGLRRRNSILWAALSHSAPGTPLARRREEARPAGRPGSGGRRSPVLGVPHPHSHRQGPGEVQPRGRSLRAAPPRAFAPRSIIYIL